MKALELAKYMDGCSHPMDVGIEKFDEIKAELRCLAEVKAELVREMGRYLPVINRAEDSEIWGDLTDVTGIATANGYRAALVKAKEHLGNPQDDCAYDAVQKVYDAARDCASDAR
jgi:hypothetical protein